MAAAARRGRMGLHAFSAATIGLCGARRFEHQSPGRDALGRAREAAWRGASQRHAQDRGARRHRGLRSRGSKGGMMKKFGLALTLIASVTGFDARAQTYPSRPVTVVVTAAAGGLTDLIARGVGQQLSELWGQSVIIENKGGAGHLIGAASVAKAAPDGYTLMVSESGTFVSNPF